MTEGKRLASIEEIRRCGIAPGDSAWLRDFARLAPSDAWTHEPVRGSWNLRAYRLADGTSGRLLQVNDRADDEPEAAVPPEIEISLDLPGWYAVWVGVPHLDLRPRLGEVMGVDVALDGEPGFVHVHPEAGVRKGRVMVPANTEVMCFWKCAPLSGRTLRVRVPFGTFLSQPWGLVRAAVSSLRLVRLSEAQVAAYRRESTDPQTKRVYVVMDGFSHYWFAGAPGKGIDARFVQSLRDSDVRGVVFQTPATGTANWPSARLPLLGEMVPTEKWPNLRRGDRRAYDYVTWACRNGQEGMRVLSELCRAAGLEFHASLRMNLAFSNDGILGNGMAEMFNGRFWFTHRECRLGQSLDYGRTEVRQFILGTLMELAQLYDVTGVNLDFTRWPPVILPHNPPELGTQFICEVRQSLDRIGQARGRRIALSAFVVDGYHARLTLAEQRIDLEAWLASGALDFVGVQAWDQAAYCALAKRYGAAYYMVQDQDPFVPDGWRNDPAWQEAGSNQDPVPGEELLEQPPLNSILDPTELDGGLAERYRLGISGVCLVNVGAGRFVRRLGHPEEMAARPAAGEVWGQEIGPEIRLESTQL